MTTATAKKHTHRFETDSKGISTCKCGRKVKSNINEFNLKSSNVEVLAEGDPDYVDSDPAAASSSEPAPAQVPPKPSGRGSIITQYYDDNKEAILKDLEERGLERMLRRWDMKKEIFLRCLKRWDVSIDLSDKHDLKKSEPLQSAAEKQTEEEMEKASHDPGMKADRQSKWKSYKPDKDPVIDPVSGSGAADVEDILKKLLTAIASNLPPMPAFNEAWQPEVKIKWLEVYHDLVKGMAN